MKKDIALSCRTLDMTQDLSDILKNLELGSKKNFSSKFRIVNKQGRIWAWLRHILGLETTYPKDVAEAFVRFTKNNRPLFMEKKIEENHLKARLILGHILGLKIEGGEILVNESPSKAVLQFEKYVNQSPYLKSFPSKARPKAEPQPKPEPIPRPNPEPTPAPISEPIPGQDQSLAEKILQSPTPIDLGAAHKFFLHLDRLWKDKPAEEVVTYVSTHPDLMDAFLKIVQECVFDESKQAIKCLKDMCYLGGCCQDETKIQDLYARIQDLNLSNDLKQSLMEKQLLSLTLRNKHVLFASILSKCINPNREKLWATVVEFGLVEIAQALLKEGGLAEWEFTYIDGDDNSVLDCATSCLHRLARYGTHANTIQIAELVLAEHPKLLNMQAGGTGNTPLIEAIEKSNLPMVTWLLSKKPDLTLKDDHGKTAYVIAVEQNIKLL